VQTDLHDGPIEPAGSFVEVGSDDLVLTALKMAEDDSGIVVRGVNLGEAPIEPEVAVHAPCLSNPSRVRLDEEPLEGTPSVRPREIVTLKFHATQE
jgi:alpha-mannosidase